MRRLLKGCWLVVLLGSSCAGGMFRRQTPPDPVRLNNATASFPSEGRGEFRLDLQVPNPTSVAGKVTAIDWELWLNNHWFASGTGILSEDIPPKGGLVQITLAVAFGRLPTSSGPTPLKLSAHGSLTARLGGSEEQLRFSGTATIEAKNVPLLERSETD